MLAHGLGTGGGLLGAGLGTGGGLLAPGLGTGGGLLGAGLVTGGGLLAPALRTGGGFSAPGLGTPTHKQVMVETVTHLFLECNYLMQLSQIFGWKLGKNIDVLKM